MHIIIRARFTTLCPQKHQPSQAQSRLPVPGSPPTSQASTTELLLFPASKPSQLCMLEPVKVLLIIHIWVTRGYNWDKIEVHFRFKIELTNLVRVNLYVQLLLLDNYFWNTIQTHALIYMVVSWCDDLLEWACDKPRSAFETFCTTLLDLRCEIVRRSSEAPRQDYEHGCINGRVLVSNMVLLEAASLCWHLTTGH